MENNGIINFNEFFKDQEPKKTGLNRDDFKDFFITDNEKEEEPSHIESVNERIITDPDMVDSSEINELELEKTGHIMQKSQEEDTDTDLVPESNENYYLVYKDKSEDFSCDIQLEGANLLETEARLILESEDWTLMFNGQIDSSGKCLIPIKKLAILNEGIVGKIRLEVIAEGTVFTPWEDDFKVKLSKKVAVKIHESKSHPKKPEPKKTGVKVSVKR